MARNELAAGGDNAAAVVEDLGHEIFGKKAFNWGKKPYDDSAKPADAAEAREKAKFYILASWAEFDEAGDEKNGGRIIHLGRLIYGVEEFNAAKKSFNED